MLYKKDEEKQRVIGIFLNTDEMAAFAYEILEKQLVLKKNNGIYFAKSCHEPYGDWIERQFVFNENKEVLLPVQKVEDFGFGLEEEEFLDEENLLLSTMDDKGDHFLEHYRIKDQQLKFVKGFANTNKQSIDKLNCFDEGYIIINGNRVYNFKTGELCNEVFDYIYTKDTIGYLKADETVKDPLIEFVKKNDIALGVLSVKATQTMPGKRKKEERMAFVKLDRKGQLNSNLFYIEDYDIQQISLKEHSFDDAVHLLQMHLDSLALSAHYNRDKLPKKINKAIKKSLNK